MRTWIPPLALLANGLCFATGLILGNEHPFPVPTESSAVRKGSASPAAVAATVKQGSDASGPLSPEEAMIGRIKALNLGERQSRLVLDAYLRSLVYEEPTGAENKAWWRNDCAPTRLEEARRRLEKRERLASLREQAGLPPEFDHNLERMPPSFLTGERREALWRISRDYAALFRKIDAESLGCTLPRDEEARALLNKEYQKDLEAFLSPEEKEELALRNSSGARRAANKYGAVVKDEAQFKALVALYENHEERCHAAKDLPERSALRRSSEQQLEAEARELLGTQAMADLVVLNDADFAYVEAATRRLGLPPELPNRFLELRSAAEAETRRLTASASLDRKQLKEALTALGERLQSQMTALAGAELTEAFAENYSWLRLLKNGNAFAIEDTGGLRTIWLED